MALFGTLHPSSNDGFVRYTTSFKYPNKEKLGGVKSADLFRWGGGGGELNTQPFPCFQYIGPEDWLEDGP